MPWELGISEAQQALIENGLREKVIIETDGKLMSGRDVAIACLLGAEEFGFASGPLVSMGCMMMRVCSLDTCPFGIATQNEELRKRFKGKPEHVMNFMKFIAEELREIMAELGFRTIDEMVGRNDCLKVKDNSNIHLSRLVHTDVANAEYRHHVNGESFDFHLDQTIDEKELIPSFLPYIEKKKPFKYSIHVSSENRTTGTLLGSLITEKCKDTLKEDTYVIECQGGGGQSFGAFIPKGMSLYLKGDANDHVGKGLSGGKIVVTPDSKSKYDPSENIIVGNVALYGATSGKAYFEGIAGERFCVRNSGAEAVVEGCGDHGLEYMTGGKVVVLGKVGKNFAAGMSGGIAYVLDQDHDLYKKLNKALVSVQEVHDKYDKQQLKEMIQDYYQETHSPKAKMILKNFEEYSKEFKKIVPSDYAKMLTLISHFEEQCIAHDKAEFEAFQAMKKGA